VATLYRCKTPTNWLCACGKVARRLRRAGIAYDEVRVPLRRRDRDEVDELSDQRWVPLLVHGRDVVCDSHRIVEFVDWLEAREAEASEPAGREPAEVA
jgi:glutathione S-transferase